MSQTLNGKTSPQATSVAQICPLVARDSVWEAPIPRRLSTVPAPLLKGISSTEAVSALRGSPGLCRSTGCGRLWVSSLMDFLYFCSIFLHPPLLLCNQEPHCHLLHQPALLPSSFQLDLASGRNQQVMAARRGERMGYLFPPLFLVRSWDGQ